VQDNPIFLISYITLWLLIIFQTFVLLELVRRVASGHVGAASEEEGADLLETGAPAPHFEAKDVLTGRPVTSAEYAGRPTMLLFVSPGCAVCEHVTQQVLVIKEQIQASLLVVCMAKAPACEPYGTEYREAFTTVYDRDHAIARSFKIKQAPTAVVINRYGLVERYGAPHSVSQLDFGPDLTPPAGGIAGHSIKEDAVPWKTVLTESPGPSPSRQP
jgi:thiol-disulfide isomerase/thioredoxin